jgi:F plasmid transfer operon, TraF, protein
VGHLRAGLVARNLREPSFETPEPSVSLTLDRQVRAGVAWDVDGGKTMVACDVDLTRTDAALGPQRHVAIGGERWWADHRLGTRAGLRIDTVDDAQPVGSAGVSVRVTPSWYVDGQITHGAASSDRSWGVALRFAY